MIEDPDSFWDELLSFVEAKSVILIVAHYLGAEMSPTRIHLCDHFRHQIKQSAIQRASWH